MRLFLLPLCLAIAVITAGLYGALHNQISFTVGPSYFFDFKFHQFDTELAWQNHFGAALIGFQASWWMGVLIGGPIYLAGGFFRDPKQFVRAYVQATLLVVGIALLCGLGALAYGILEWSPDHLPFWMSGRNVSDPVGFARAGTLHNTTYLSGLIGLLAGCAFMIWRGWTSRRGSA